MFYRNGSVYASNETFEIDAEIDTGMSGEKKKKSAWLYWCFIHLNKCYYVIILIIICLIGLRQQVNPARVMFATLLFLLADCIEFHPMHHPSPEDIISHFTLHFKRFVWNLCLVFKILSACVYVRELRSSMIQPPLSPRLVSVTVTFVLEAINLQTVRYRELPDCYDFTVTVCDMTRQQSLVLQVWHRSTCSLH